MGGRYFSKGPQLATDHFCDLSFCWRKVTLGNLRRLTDSSIHTREHWKSRFAALLSALLHRAGCDKFVTAYAYETLAKVGRQTQRAGFWHKSLIFWQNSLAM